MTTIAALLAMLPALLGEPALSIDVRLSNWMESGIVEVNLRNRSNSTICVAERLTDVRSVSVQRQGREVSGNSAVPFIGYRGPYCRTLLPGEIITIELNVSDWQPDRSRRDRVCYTKSYGSSEVEFEEVTGCASPLPRSSPSAPIWMGSAGGN